MAEEKKEMEGPSVLILGGVGFLGRNLVKYLRDNKLAGFIRVCDKAHWKTSNMNQAHTEAFNDTDLVEFKQADLTKDMHVERAFADKQFDYVFNCCGETRFGLSEADYQTKCQVTAEKCAQAAADNKVKMFVEVSHAQVYGGGKDTSNEDGKIKPWTLQAQYRYAAEESIKKVKGLKYTILRPVYVYGSGDMTGLGPRLACAAVYKFLDTKMQLLWTKDLKINVVHVEDVCSAMWLAAAKAKSGSVYNLADKTDLDQGSLNDILAALFGIKTGFHGSMKSNLAKMAMGKAAASANDDHVPAWAKICAEHKIVNSPISPYIDKELLYNNNLSVDGSLICKDLGFQYKYPKVTVDTVRAQVEEYIANGHFPNYLI